MDPANFATLVNAGVGLIVAILTIVFAPKAKAVLDNKLSEQQRTVLYPALQYAVTFAQAKLGLSNEQSQALSDTARAQLIDEAVKYVRAQVPDVLDALQITDESLRRLIEARWQSALNYFNVTPAK